MFTPCFRVGAAGAFIACSAFAQCPPEWVPGAPTAINSGDFWDAINFDPDGPGPAPADLVVGGGFEDLVPDQPFSHALARWDGRRWHSLVFIQPGSSLVKALATFDFDANGPEPARLVVGGRFALGFGAGAATNILSTTGMGYSRLSDGLDDEVRDLLVFDPDADGPLPPRLFAAGNFRRSGSRNITPVAMWDGALWQSVGTLSGPANALDVIDLDGDGPNPPRLVAGGRLTAGGQVANVALFDGTSWTRLGSLDNEVYDLEVFDLDGAGPNPPRLCASGIFRNTSLNGQAYFNGSSWQPIAPAPNFPFTTGRAIKAFDLDGPGPEPERLYLAGSVAVIGQPQPIRVAELRQGAWTVLAGSDYSGNLYSMATVTLPGSDDPSLLVMGEYVGPAPARWPFNIGVATPAGLEPFGRGLTGPVQVIEPTTVRGEHELLVLGGAPYIPGSDRGGISLFDGQTWQSIGQPSSTSSVTAAISGDIDGDNPLGEQIVVTGFIESIDGVPMQNVGVYNGASWSALGSLASFATDLEFFDPDADGPARPVLLAAGGIVSGGPGTPNFLYRWTGSAWVQFGPEFVSANGPAQVSYMTVFDPDADGPTQPQLVVVGSFSRVGTVAAANVAAFNGSTWSPLGSGFQTNPQAAFTWDPNADGREVVVVTGSFTTAGGVQARGAAVWNGAAWSPLGSGFGVSQSGFQNFPTEFAIFRGELYAAGPFSEVTGGPGNGIVRWNGKGWSPVGTGLDPAGARALAVLPPGEQLQETLAVGGNFQSAGGWSSAYFAQYAAQPCCPADANADGSVDSADFFLFLSRFMALQGEADFNADGVIDSRDFFEYLAAYFGVC